MWFTKFALKRPVSLLMCVLAVLVLGISAIFGMPMELMPPMELPMFVVNTVYPTAAPEDIENLVTKPIESALGTVSGVKNITSISQENVSTVILELDYNTNLDEVSTSIQEKLNIVKPNLPEEANAPSAIRLSADNALVSYISVTSDTYDNLGNLVKSEIAPQFEKLAGVAGTDVYGAKEQYIKVSLKENKLSQYNLSSDVVMQLISLTNLNIPAGSIERGDQKLLLRGKVQYESLAELRSMPITLNTGDVITLEDVADVSLITEKEGSISRRDGKPNITININKMQDANTVDVSKEVRKLASEISKSYDGTEITVIADQGEFITNAISSVIKNLIAGGLISMVVLWFFLGDIKASLIIATSIPFSVILTFVIMDWAGISVNLFSMGGLVVGVGMIVDNSIVVLESMYRKKQEGLSFSEAAKEGVKIVVSAIIASTATTIVVFLPISVIKGMTGQLFGPVGFTVIFSLTASLISALTLVPALFVKVKPEEKLKGKSLDFINKINTLYSKGIRKVLGFKKTAITFAITLLVISLALVPIIGLELMPPVDMGQINISVKGKNGLTVSELDKYITKIENIVNSYDETDSYTSTSSDGGSGSVDVYLKKKTHNLRSTNEMEKVIRNDLSAIVGADITVSQSSGGMMGMGQDSVSVELKGRDINKLSLAADKVISLMKEDSTFINPTSSLHGGNPEARIVVSPLKSAAYGLNPASVISSVRQVITGKTVASYTIEGNSYDVRVEMPSGLYKNVSDLGGINIKSPAGSYVPLLDIAEIKFDNGPTQIQRKNNQYLVTVSSQVDGENVYSAQLKLLNQIKKSSLPAGVEIMESGQSAQVNREFAEILKALVLSVALVFMIMAGQFESIWFSLIVMATVPFSIIGALFGLLIMGNTISMVSLVGLIILVGTVINNSIVLIDYTGQLRKQGKPIRDALIEAGETRLRPILMSTLTTVLAMIPMSLGIGEGSEVMQSLSITVMGGLLFAVFITLFLIPVIYEISATNREIKAQRKLLPALERKAFDKEQKQIKKQNRAEEKRLRKQKRLDKKKKL